MSDSCAPSRDEHRCSLLSVYSLSRIDSIRHHSSPRLLSDKLPCSPSSISFDNKVEELIHAVRDQWMRVFALGYSVCLHQRRWNDHLSVQSLVQSIETHQHQETESCLSRQSDVRSTSSDRPVPRTRHSLGSHRSLVSSRLSSLFSSLFTSLPFRYNFADGTSKEPTASYLHWHSLPVLSLAFSVDGRHTARHSFLSSDDLLRSSRFVSFVRRS